jgi:alpha-tubulin suppressor-like RCC1 family protein
MCTGTKENLIRNPWPIDRPLSLSMEIVRMVACSSRHTLVLTSLGLIYSCGDNTEGALGTGDVNCRQKLSVLSQWFSVDYSVAATNTDSDLIQDRPSVHRLSSTPPVIVKISAGAGVIGSHSMALDENGNLYSWGVAQATGLGSFVFVLCFEFSYTLIRIDDYGTLSSADRHFSYSPEPKKVRKLVIVFNESRLQL